MGWRPVRDIAHAVCVHRFEATEQHDLALDIGDDVYITELGGTNHDWCRGWLLAQPSVLAGLTSEKGQSLKPRAYAGIFPRNCVRIREILADERERNGEDGGSSRPDTADTVAGALRSPASTLSRTASSKRSTYPSSLAKRRSLAVRPRMKQLYLRPEDTLARDPEAEKEQAPLPALKIGDTTAVSSHEPLVDEISSCLHEWHSTKVHELMLNQEYELLERVTALVKRLDEARKQFVHDLLTDKELEDLRERTIWDLVDGNKMLDGEVIVRSPTEKGRIFTSQDSIPEMLQLQAMMSLRNKPLKPPSKRPHLFHVLVDVKNFPWPLDDTATLHMYICHQQFGERPRPVSEVYAVDLPLRGPGEDLPERTPKTLFVNLTKADVGTVSDSSSRLFLICKLQRDEPIRSGVRNEAVPGQLPSEWADEVMSPSGSLRGRRSFLFGGQKARKESSRRPSFSDGRPTTEESFMRSRLQRQQSDALVTDRSSENQSRPSTIERKVRRVVGYSALDISSVVLDVGQAHHSLSLWTPAPPSIDTDEQKPDGEGDGWHDVLNFICRNAVGHFAKALSLNSFDIDIHTFAHIDVDTLVKETPALLRDVYRTPTLALLGGSELTRSDVYLTLKEPVLPSNARFFHPKEGSVPIRPDTEYRNLQLTFETPRDVLLGSQSMLLHNFASWLESFRPVMTFDAILATANEVVRATHESRAKLRMHGLVMIRALSDPEVYDDVIRPGSMVWLANCTADWLEPYWLGSIRRMICPEDVDALRLCCSIVKAQLPQSSAWRQIYIPRLLASYRILLENPESLHAADHSRLSRRNMLSELFPTTYPFHMIEIDTGSPPQEVKLEMIALLATFLQEGKPSIDVLNEHGSADPKMSMLALVTDAFQVLESVQKGSAYPRQWLSFSITEKKHQVVMLEWILDVLITEFLPDADNVLEFDDQIWARWLDLIMSLASSEAISIENFSDQKQRAVWTIGKDIRQEAADLLFRAWTALGWESTSEIRQLSGLEKVGGYQVQFTTRFMQPIVKLCMCLHHGLRTAAAQILWAMVVSEWELNGNLDVVQTAISSAFDTICRETSSSRNKMPHPEFLNDMSKRGEFTPGSSEESFHEAFLRMKQHLDHLWELLVAAHGPATDSASRLVNAIAAAHFLQDSNPEAYIRHLHDVADLHYRARHYSSAGLALGLHAELYDWDLFKNLEAMLDLRLPAESAFARKERLYGAMIRHFELGQCYEKAFPAMQELIGQYTTNAYNFDKAAKAQERLSRMYDALHTGAGYQVPRYFLVAFHGSDFPQMLAEKRFVYEGAIDDDTRSFRRKLQEQFPYASARLDQQPHTVNGVDHSQEPYMVISSVSPLKDYAHPVNLRTGVSPYTREYQLISGPRQFAITRRGNDLHRDITDQEVRKTVFTCASAFPTLMSREAVIDVEERTLSPLQAAVDRTHRKTMSLAHSLQEAKSGGDDEPWRKLVAAVRAHCKEHFLHLGSKTEALT
ncbi:Deoxycytidine kinase 1 [Zalaria obscura]|uniref:Deoxycytidine kinase 1 n=1 Tax=Zalaria obscura TaxID=2024903 RepID=A0ACC3SK53_9PEZI